MSGNDASSGAATTRHLSAEDKPPSPRTRAFVAWNDKTLAAEAKVITRGAACCAVPVRPGASTPVYNWTETSSALFDTCTQRPRPTGEASGQDVDRKSMKYSSKVCLCAVVLECGQGVGKHSRNTATTHASRRSYLHHLHRCTGLCSAPAAPPVNVLAAQL